MQKRIAVGEVSTPRWSFFQDVIRYAAAGVDQIGIWRPKVEDIGCDAAIDLLYEMKMSVSSLHWIGGFTGNEGKTFADAIEDGIEAIQFAAAVGADCVIVHPGSGVGHTRRHARRLFRNALETLTDVAADFNVRLALEPIGPVAANPWTFYRTIEEQLELMYQFPSEQLGIALDLYHIGMDHSIAERLPEIVDRVALVQLADRDRSLVNPFHSGDVRLELGTGVVDIDYWLTELDAAGYDGPLEIELHGSGQVNDTDYRHRLGNAIDFLTSHQTIERQDIVSAKAPSTDRGSAKRA